MTRGSATAVLVTALLIAGCSSGEKPPEPATGTPGAHGSLAECLRAQGVPESAGPGAVLGPPEGVDESTWQRAMQACSTLAPGPAGP